ncbi:hypothetical protein Ctob_015587, partial [Chrysochromulina tobinii]
ASSSVRARVRARPPLPFAVVSPCACCILCVCCALRLCCSSSLSPLTPPSSVSRAAAPFASLVTAARPRLGLARGSSVARCVLCVCRASSLFLCLLLFASPSLLPSVAAGAPSPSLLPTVAAGAPARSSCVPLCGSSSRARLCSPATCGSLCWSLAGAGCCWCVGRASEVATLWVSSCASTSTCARRRVSRCALPSAPSLVHPSCLFRPCACAWTTFTRVWCGIAILASSVLSSPDSRSCSLSSSLVGSSLPAGAGGVGAVAAGSPSVGLACDGAVRGVSLVAASRAASFACAWVARWPPWLASYAVTLAVIASISLASASVPLPDAARSSSSRMRSFVCCHFHSAIARVIVQPCLSPPDALLASGAPYERCRCLNSPDGVYNVVRPGFADSLSVGRWTAVTWRWRNVAMSPSFWPCSCLSSGQTTVDSR